MGREEACGRGDISREAQMVLEEAEKTCDKTLNLEKTPRLQVTRRHSHLEHGQALGWK